MCQTDTVSLAASIFGEGEWPNFNLDTWREIFPQGLTKNIYSKREAGREGARNFTFTNMFQAPLSDLMTED